jgi:hypothetical protein
VRTDNDEPPSGELQTAPTKRFKTGLQQLLGSLVLLALPTIPGAMFIGWNTVSDLAAKQQQFVFQLTSMALRLEQDRAEFKERLLSLRQQVYGRLDKFDSWKDQTNSNRFRKSDGDTLSDRLDQTRSSLSHRLDRLEHDQIEHNTQAQKWIAIIERNTPIIFSNQRKAHSHQRQLDPDR